MLIELLVEFFYYQLVHFTELFNFFDRTWILLISFPRNWIYQTYECRLFVSSCNPFFHCECPVARPHNFYQNIHINIWILHSLHSNVWNHEYFRRTLPVYWLAKLTCWRQKKMLIGLSSECYNVRKKLPIYSVVRNFLCGTCFVAEFLHTMKK